MTHVVAIDGPAGAGKSTIAAAVAARLGLERLDTGSMYRAVALAVLRAGVDPGDAASVTAICRRLGMVPGTRFLLDGEDVTEAIRSAEVNAVVSAVAAHPGVREDLVRRQREWVDERGGGVVEGRDIGTVVFPDAKPKIYLTASPEERARRRAVEEGAATAEAVGLQESELRRRDHLDGTRTNSPLAMADDAHLIDSTGVPVETLVEEVLALL
ncbi:MAG TPA: (d)CMP kinase [Acidimicrobiales bacterium]|nr:(d)CMP kinase [Acidimicrobiales bacterium]